MENLKEKFRDEFLSLEVSDLDMSYGVGQHQDFIIDMSDL